MTKKLAKGLVMIVAVGVLIYACLGLFVRCTDYGYVFHFYVIGGNGRIISPESEWEQDGKTFVSVMGGKIASEKHQYKLEFIAEPNEGYQVKEWRYNNEVVKENTSNSFTAVVSKHTQDIIIITVEFEPIPNENNE